MKPAIKKYVLVTAAIWLTCCIGLLLFHLLLIAPQQNDIEQSTIQITQTAVRNQKLRKAATPAAQARIKNTLENHQEKLTDFVIDSKDASRLNFVLNNIADHIDDIKTSSFTSQILPTYASSKINEYEHFREQRMNVTFVSNFEGFAHFLNALERSQPVIFVDKFSVEPEKRKDSSDLIIDMNLAVFASR